MTTDACRIEAFTALRDSEMHRPPGATLAPIAVLFLFSARVLFGQAASLPDAPGRDTVQRLCGACHPATVVLGHGMNREGWGQVVASMITRGAKGTPAEFETVTDYLAKNLPLKGARAGALSQRRGSFPAGPRDRQTVDPAAAERGKAVFISDCSNCHGALARGGSNGPDLVRSTTVLHDHYGDTIGPYLLHTHPAPGAPPIASLTKNQILDISHFLHKQVEDTLRSGPYTKVLNVLTGNAQAGAAYFDGDGACTTCHSTTGDLAGIASKYDPPTLQQRLLFPRSPAPGHGPMAAPKPVTVTVTTENGESISGTLVHLDDFSVAMRDAAGNYRSWQRTPQLKIDVHNPYAAHEALLDKITDTDIHNLVAYLETLK
ncbi:MAG TPA: c-type cytochrome [Bryobacteraceae bacterium]|nr:c-type cytochrome [Bryobacteraceae bacterium]